MSDESKRSTATSLVIVTLVGIAATAAGIRVGMSVGPLDEPGWSIPAACACPRQQVPDDGYNACVPPNLRSLEPPNGAPLPAPQRVPASWAPATDVPDPFIK